MRSSIRNLVLGESDDLSRLVRIAARLTSGALLGKVLGFARELMMARSFGTSMVADSFRSAVTVIFLPLAPLLSEGVPAVLIPMYRKWQREGEAPRRLASLTIALCLVAAALMVAVWVFGHWWVALMVGGFQPQAQALTLSFARLMALSMPALVVLGCLAASELATGRSFIGPLRAPMMNVAVIAGIALFVVTGDLLLLPWCYSITINALALWALWLSWRQGTIDFQDVHVLGVFWSGAEFLRELRPMLPHPIAEQGQIWLERRVGSGLSVGTIASLDYARTITDTAFLLVSYPIGMALLSHGNSADTGSQVRSIARPILAIGIPVSMFLAFFAPDVVRLVFARGAFNDLAVFLTSGALRGIALGLWAATLGWILIRLLNNAGRNYHAMLILVAAFGINAAANALTAFLPVDGQGAFLLGAGEAARGVVLLLGTCLALRCHWAILHLIGRCLPSAVLMAGGSILIQQHVLALLPRLGLGILICLACCVVAVCMLMPNLIRLAVGGGVAEG